MRSVTTTIAKLGLNIGDTITVQLINSVGKACMTTDGYIYDETIELDSDTLTLLLRENDTILGKSLYKITLPNDFSFSFTVPTATDTDNKPLDLIGILKVGCFENIITIYGDTTVLASGFIEKLDLYFTGENPHFTPTEKSLVDLYVYYADEVIDTDSTIDVVEMMDKHLATLLPNLTQG